jgi:hypothetical protein
MIDYLLRMITSYRPRYLPRIVIEEQEQARPERDAARRVLAHGRSINLAYSADGKMQLRRRARQIRREFGKGVQWAAMPKADRDARPLRRRFPWWWIH